MTENSFKERVQGHYTSFNKIAYKNDTSLSKYIWGLKNNNEGYQLSWEILEQIPKYRPGQLFCNVCIAEKNWIIAMDEDKRLNRNDECVAAIS